MVVDRLVASPTELQLYAPDGNVRDPVGMASLRGEQSMFGGRLQFRDWASVVAGSIRAAPIENYPGDDGRQLASDAVDSTEPNRLYLGLGVPRYNVHAHILFDPNDVTPDTLDVRLNRIPLFYYDLFGQFALRYIEDESQLTLELGVQNIAGFLSVDVGFEHRPVNLRHARIRADWSAFSGWDAVELAEIQPGLEAYPRFGFDYGAFAETAWFQSRHLREQTGDGGVWGMYAGFFVRPDITILMGRLDIFFGVNRPEHIERLSQSADHWEFGVRTHGRFGL